MNVPDIFFIKDLMKLIPTSRSPARWRIPIFLIASILLTSCFENQNSSSRDGPSIDASDDPLFGAANTVFYNKCSSCHDYHRLTTAQLIATGRVVAGSPESSPIYYRNQGSLGPGLKNMPIGSTISAAELAAIYDWISSIP